MVNEEQKTEVDSNIREGAQENKEEAEGTTGANVEGKVLPSGNRSISSLGAVIPKMEKWLQPSIRGLFPEERSPRKSQDT